MSADEPTADAQGGEEFGKYTIYGKIAAGGMASVFLGRERENARRWVAIKRVHPHLIARRDVVQMFLNEAKILSRLDHPNICGIIDFGIIQDSPYIVMRYLHGVPLSSLLRRLIDQKKALPVDLMAYIAACTLEGLHYAHESSDDDGKPLGLVHRDISPQNIFITFDGEIALLDFGVAKAAGYAGFTRTGHIKGKYAYMSPEQVEAHPLDRRSDVFALGIVLWESLAGKHLFRRKRHIDTLRAIANADVPSISNVNPNVPHALEAIIARSLVGDRRLRYSTAKAMANDLFAYLSQRTTGTGGAEASDMLALMFPDRRHPSETPGMATQTEIAALDTDVEGERFEALVDDEPDATEQLEAMSIPENTVEEGFEDATMQLNLIPEIPAPSLDSHATIPDERISFPLSINTVATTLGPSPDLTALVPEPVISRAPFREPKNEVVVTHTKKSQHRLVAAATVACAIGFGVYALVLHYSTKNTVVPALVPRVEVATPKVQPREEKIDLPQEPAVPLDSTTKRTKMSKTQLTKARELEREGRRALLTGDLSRAEKLLLDCTRIAPLPPCYRSLGVIYAQLQDTKASLTNYKKYLELAPNASDAPYVKRIVEEAKE
jgi:serine/threonine protein kinase